MDAARAPRPGHLRGRVVELEAEAEALRAENERLRRLLNDPDRLIQRGLKLLAFAAVAATEGVLNH